MSSTTSPRRRSTDCGYTDYGYTYYGCTYYGYTYYGYTVPTMAVYGLCAWLHLLCTDCALYLCRTLPLPLPLPLTLTLIR